MNLLLIVLALPASQDDAPRRARALIEELRSDQVEERDRAFERLVELGPPVLPTLRQAKEDPDAEVAQRIESAIGEIRRRERLQALRPPVKRLTLDLKAPTAQEAAVQALAGFGVEVSVREPAAGARGPVPFAVKEATVWETLDALEPQLGLRCLPSPFYSASTVRPVVAGDREPEEVVRWTTLKDIRIFVRSRTLRTATGEISPYFEFAAVLPPQTLAFDVQMDGLASEGKPLCLSPGPRRMLLGQAPPPRRPGYFNTCDTRVTSLDPGLLKDKKRISIKGNLILFFPRDLDLIEFGEEARKGPVLRESAGIRLSFSAKPADATNDAYLSWISRNSDPQTFLVCNDDGKGRWLGDHGVLTVEAGEGTTFWRSGGRLITLLRLKGTEKVTLPFEIADVPVPIRAEK